MLLGRNARAERAVYDEIRLRQRGLEEQGVGDDADIRAHAAKLDAEALSVRRAHQIATELKTELNRKLADFSSPTDTMEETFENREQIEISRYYERLPKPVIIATEEFLDHELVYKEGKDGVMKEI